jgi:UDP:flavonoid glycosyltransferase YjiC (YdhE family)
MCLLNGPDIAPRMSYDPTTIAVLRRALDEVLLDARFRRNRSASALEIAEHILAQAAAGERDLERLKSSAFSKLRGELVQNQAA